LACEESTMASCSHPTVIAVAKRDGKCFACVSAFRIIGCPQIHGPVAFLPENENWRPYCLRGGLFSFVCCLEGCYRDGSSGAGDHRSGHPAKRRAQRLRSSRLTLPAGHLIPTALHPKCRPLAREKRRSAIPISCPPRTLRVRLKKRTPRMLLLPSSRSM